MRPGPPLEKAHRRRRLARQHLGLGEVAAHLEIQVRGMVRQQRLQQGHGAGAVLLLHQHAAAQQPHGGIAVRLAGEQLRGVVRPLQRQGEGGRHQPAVPVAGFAQGPGAEHGVCLHHPAVLRRQHSELAGRGRGRLLEQGAGEVDLGLVPLAQRQLRPARLIKDGRLGVLGVGERLERRQGLRRLAQLEVEDADDGMDGRRRGRVLLQGLEPRQGLGGLARLHQPGHLLHLLLQFGRRLGRSSRRLGSGSRGRGRLRRRRLGLDGGSEEAKGEDQQGKDFLHRYVLRAAAQEIGATSWNTRRGRGVPGRSQAGTYSDFKNSCASLAYLLLGSSCRSFWRSALASLFWFLFM